jgi:riboflavin synthase
VFTGIIEEVGEVTGVERNPRSARLRVRGPLVTQDVRHGDSLALNGVCLTVTAAAGGEFSADVMSETLDRSSLGQLAPGDPVNLERAVPLGGRLGGHLVQGHVDGVARVVSRTPGEDWETVVFTLPGDLARYVVEKGSIAVDGVSLTVAGVTAGTFSVGLIPTTLASTTLGRRRPGDLVNLETDVLGKYVERLLAAAPRGAAAPADGAVTR